MTLVLRHNVIGREVAPAVTLDRRRRRLSSVVARHADRSRPFIVSVHRRGQLRRPTDDTVRLRKAWSQTLIGPADCVLITYVPRGGGSGANTGKQIGGAIALIALAVVAPYALAAIGVTGLLASAATAGIVLGGAYLIGKATQPKANTATQLYGVSGGGNLPQPGGRIPAPYGHFVTQPDQTQPDYSIYEGEDQVLYKRHTLGLGKYQIHRIQIGDATLWNEDAGVQAPFVGAPGGAEVYGSTGGSEVEIIQPGGTSSLVPDAVYSSPSVSAVTLPHANDNPNLAGPFPVCPVGTQTARIQLDYSLPGGIFQTTPGGVQGVAPWGVHFQYAPCDDGDNPTGAWQDLFVTPVYVQKITGAQRYTQFVNVTAGRYLVRGQNLGESLNTLLFPGYTRTNEVTWDGLRARVGQNIVRPHVTEIAMKVRSGKSLGVTAFGNIWVEATRILPTWNGSAWVDAPTRKSVYAFADILRSTYGGNLDDSEVDLDRVKFYAGELSQFDTFDGVIRGPVSVYDACATVLGTMRAEPARIANTWSINRDEERAVARHVFTRRQIVRGTTAATFQVARDDGAADVIAEYNPDGDPRSRRDLRVTFGAEMLTPSRVQLLGVSDHDHAHHLATWKSSAAYFRRERRKVTVDRRGRLVTRGDPARIDAWFMADAKAAGVLSHASLEMVLDTDVTVGDATYLLLRNRKNLEWGPVKVTAGANAHTVELDAGDVAAVEDFFGQTLGQAIAADNQEMTSVLIGPLTELQDTYLIDSVQPQGRDRIAIEALFDHPGVWTALGEAISPAPPIPSARDILTPAVAVIPWVTAKCNQKGVTLTMEWAVGRARGAVQNIITISYDDATWETVSQDLSTSGTYPLRHEEGANVTVKAFAVNAHGVPGPTVTTHFSTFPPAVNSDTANLEVSPAAMAAEVQQQFRVYNDRISDIEDFVGTVVAQQDIGNWEDKRKAATDAGLARIDIIKANADIVVTQKNVVTLGDNLGTLTDSFNGFAGPDGVFVQNLHLITARFDDNEGRISTVEEIVIGPDSVLTRTSERLEAGLGNNTGSLASLEITYTAFAGPGGVYAEDKLDLIAALTGDSNSINGRFTASATLEQTYLAFAGPGGAYAQDQASLSAAMTGDSNLLHGRYTASALLEQTYLSFAGPGGAYAQDRLHIVAAINGSSATIDGQATAVATIDGRLAAFYGLTVDANGHAASMQLASDGTFAGIRFKADAILISLNGYDDVAPFGIGLVNGVPALGFKGDTFLDGEVYITKSLHVGGEVIDTNHLIANSVTVPIPAHGTSNVFTAAANAVSTVMTASGTVKSVPGRTVTVILYGWFDVTVTAGSSYHWECRINGATIIFNTIGGGGQGSSGRIPLSGSLTYTADGTAQTVTIDLRHNSSNTNDFVSTRDFVGLAVKA